MAKNYDGEKLKAIREKKGLTQRELSQKSGVSEGHIRRLEKGGIRPLSGKTIRELIQALKISENEIHPDDDYWYIDSSEFFAFVLKHVDGLVIDLDVFLKEQPRRKLANEAIAKVAALVDLREDFKQSEWCREVQPIWDEFAALRLTIRYVTKKYIRRYELFDLPSRLPETEFNRTLTELWGHLFVFDVEMKRVLGTLFAHQESVSFHPWSLILGEENLKTLTEFPSVCGGPITIIGWEGSGT